MLQKLTPHHTFCVELMERILGWRPQVNAGFAQRSCEGPYGNWEPPGPLWACCMQGRLFCLIYKTKRQRGLKDVLNGGSQLASIGSALKT